MKTVDFTQHLLNVQSELFRFAFKLTADREEANDLLQESKRLRDSILSPIFHSYIFAMYKNESLWI